MIPLQDNVPTRSLPVINWLLIGANLAVFSYELLLPPGLLTEFILTYGARPASFTLSRHRPDLLLTAPWTTLLTSMFLHGGVTHVAGNMLYLWIFGDNVEDAVGHSRYLIFYLICGVSAALFQIGAGPASRVPLIGASGAIAGILGAFMLLFPTARIRTLFIFIILVRIIPIPAVFVLGLWFVLQVLSAPASGSTGVAFFAHIGGFMVGMLLIGFFVRSRRRPA